jgi:hypothetical protein
MSVRSATKCDRAKEIGIRDRHDTHALAVAMYAVFETIRRHPFDLRHGFACDWPNSRTGWMSPSVPGQQPERRWNASSCICACCRTRTFIRQATREHPC